MASKKAKKPRPPERDYSHRALLDKLGVKPEQRVSILGISDESFLKDLRSRTGAITDGDVSKEPELIFLAAEETATLSRMKPLAHAIKGAAAIWVVYPKGQRHIRETDVIAAGKTAGLTDNKVVRFSETHTALRFVIPVAKR